MSNTGERIVDARESVYGDKVESYRRIAEVWSGILGHHINATDVVLCMIGLKAVRAQVTPDYSDNSNDIEGYLGIFRSIVGDSMIDAQLTSEYLEKKQGPCTGAGCTQDGVHSRRCL